jgi:hypothetical protein
LLAVHSVVQSVDTLFMLYQQMYHYLNQVQQVGKSISVGFGLVNYVTAAAAVCVLLLSTVLRHAACSASKMP